MTDRVLPRLIIFLFPYRFPRGAKTVKQCTLDMLKTDGSVPMINLFKQKRTKGWWPMYIKTDNDGLLLQVSTIYDLNITDCKKFSSSEQGIQKDLCRAENLKRSWFFFSY